MSAGCTFSPTHRAAVALLTVIPGGPCRAHRVSGTLPNTSSNISLPSTSCHPQGASRAHPVSRLHTLPNTSSSPSAAHCPRGLRPRTPRVQAAPLTGQQSALLTVIQGASPRYTPVSGCTLPKAIITASLLLPLLPLLLENKLKSKSLLLDASWLRVL